MSPPPSPPTAAETARTGGTGARPAFPALFRRSLERLGPIFVKIGQFLALRPDLVPRELCLELLDLVDRVPPSADESPAEVFAQDFGRSLEAAFSAFDLRPVAAASLAQVYQAETWDGQQVAVKILRHGIHERVRRDLARARRLAPLVDLVRLVPGVSLREAQREISRWMLVQLDLLTELRNLQRMGALLASDPHVRVPRALPQLSSGRILTMEFLPGVLLSDLLRLVRSGSPGAPDAIAALGFDRDVLAENLLGTCLDQVFRHEVFLADLHPGNLIALPGNVIGLVDLSLVETLEIELRPGVRRFAAAAYGDDPEGMVRELLELLVPGEGADPEALRNDFLAEHHRFTRLRDLAGEPVEDESPLAHSMISVLRAARRHGMTIPPGLLTLYSSLLTAETVARQLGSRASLASVGKEFFRRLRIERLRAQLQPERIEAALLPVLEALDEPPERFLHLLQSLAEGSFVLNVESTDSPANRRGANQRTRLLTLAILWVGLAILLASGRDTLVAGRIPLSSLLWVASGATFLWLIVLWRKLPR